MQSFKQPRRLDVEVLEDRLVPTAALISLNHGMLTITDVRANDTLVIREAHNRISIDGMSGSLPASQVSLIDISLPRGYDTVVLTGASVPGQQNISAPVGIVSTVGHNTYLGLRPTDGLRDPQMTGSVLMQYPIALDWRAHGGAAGPLGRPLGDEHAAGDGVGRINSFQNGIIYWSPVHGAAEIDGAAWSKWQQMGGIDSVLGAPVANEVNSASGQGRFASFQNGAIYAGPAGTFEIQGLIDAKWLQLGGEKSPLGDPVSDELPAGDGVGRISYFQNGAIYWSVATGAHETHGAIYRQWSQTGGVNSPLGAPVSDEQASADGQGRISYFQGGAIYYNWTTGGHEVQGAIYDTWKSLGGERGRLGEPITNELEADNGRVSYFHGGTIAYD
jgi:uncharacterized protein with LGFP repeats